MLTDFAIFICTHGRPNKQYTYNLLTTCGYSGKIWLVVDDTDPSIQQYIDNYGKDKILIFNKNHFINSADSGSNELRDKCILYAKNAVEYMAQNMGLKYFAIADDDIRSFYVRYFDGDKLRRFRITQNIDSYLSAYIKYLDNSTVDTVGFGQSGNYFGGVDTFKSSNLSRLRIVYQFVIRKTKSEVRWRGWMNEDSITAILYNKIGRVWLINPSVMQTTTVIGNNSESGGMHETYQKNNSLKRCLSTMIFCPDVITPLYYKENYVLRINREGAFPKIISGRYKK